jgi:hypothetical protein
LERITLLISFNPWIVLRVLEPVELCEATLTVDIKCFAFIDPDSQFEITTDELPFFTFDKIISLPEFVLLVNCKEKFPGNEFLE